MKSFADKILDGLNLDNPVAARSYLKMVRMGPGNLRIKTLQDDQGRVYEIDEANDTQVVQAAKHIRESKQYMPGFV